LRSEQSIETDTSLAHLAQKLGPAFSFSDPSAQEEEDNEALNVWSRS